MSSLSIAQFTRKSTNSYTDEELYPVAYGRIIEPLTAYRLNGSKYVVSRYRLIIIKCPHCRREHVHKFPLEPLPHLINIKTRSPHCIFGREYEIRVSQGDLE